MGCYSYRKRWCPQPRQYPFRHLLQAWFWEVVTAPKVASLVAFVYPCRFLNSFRSGVCNMQYANATNTELLVLLFFPSRSHTLAGVPYTLARHSFIGHVCPYSEVDVGAHLPRLRAIHGWQNVTYRVHEQKVKVSVQDSHICGVLKDRI